MDGDVGVRQISEDPPKTKHAVVRLMDSCCSMLPLSWHLTTVISFSNHHHADDRVLALAMIFNEQRRYTNSDFGAGRVYWKSLHGKIIAKEAPI